MVCRMIALEAQKLHKQGVPVEQIKRDIDERFAR